MIAGVVGGCMAGMAVWLGWSSTFEGGLSAATFVKNTEYERTSKFPANSGLDNIVRWYDGTGNMFRDDPEKMLSRDFYDFNQVNNIQ
jgi:hypothetical protein